MEKQNTLSLLISREPDEVMTVVSSGTKLKCNISEYDFIFRDSVVEQNLNLGFILSVCLSH